MMNLQWAGLVHPGGARISLEKSAVGWHPDRTGWSFCTRWEKAPGAATSEGHKKWADNNTGDKGNWTPERRVCSTTRNGGWCKGWVTRVGEKGNESDVGWKYNRALTLSSRPQRRTMRNLGASDQIKRIGRRMKLQSGGQFDQGAATAGEFGLSIFRKRPDPERKTTALRPDWGQKIKLLC